MATVQNLYTGDGSTVLFSFTFPYIDEAHIKVSVDGVDTTEYTLANATTVEFNVAPSNGAAIRIYRVTPDETAEATFFTGSAIRASDLNDNFEQLLFVAQESSFTANAANDTANDIAGDAATALATANTALATANAAESTANGIAATAAEALSTANAAEATANGIAATANTALSTANSASAAATNAVNTANAAESTANGIAATAAAAAADAAAAVADAAAAQATADAALPKAGGTISGNVDNTSTGYFDIPAGTTAQRPGSPNSGMIRYNTDTNQYEGYGASAWGVIGGGAKGASGNQIFYENDQTVTADYTITSGKNAMTAGPVTIGSGITVTVPSGSVWTVV